MQTAVVESSGVANPHVPVLKLRVVSLSPTVAGRDLTLCRLKSHMAEELLSCERPTNPNSIAENGPTSHHTRLARDTCSTLALPSARYGLRQSVSPPKLGGHLSFSNLSPVATLSARSIRGPLAVVMTVYVAEIKGRGIAAFH